MTIGNDWSARYWPAYGEIVPNNDLREHDQGEACWCNPTWDECVLVHHSLDGREAFERGERLHS